MARDGTYKRGMALIFAAGVLWSLMGLAIRLIGPAGTWQILFYRSLGAAPVLFLLVSKTSGGKPFAAIGAAGWPGLVGGLGLVFAFAGAIFSMQTTSIANAVFLFGAAPLITATLALLFLGETARPATWVAIALATIGIFVMMREGLHLGVGLGSFAALASAAGFAAFTVTLRWGRLNDMIPAVLIGASLAIIVSALVIVLRGESLTLPPRSIAIAMLMGVFLIGGGMMLYTTGSRAVPAAECNLLSMVEILLSPVWVWLILNETATRSTLLGGAVLMSAIALNALSGIGRAYYLPRRKKRERA